MHNPLRPGTARTTLVAAATLCLSLVCLPATHAAPPAAELSAEAQTRMTAQINAIMKDKAARNPAQHKMDSHLIYAAREAATGTAVAAVPTLRANAKASTEGRIEVDLKGTITDALLAAIKAQGGQIISSHPEYDAVRASLPVANIEAIAGRAEIRFIRRAVKAHYHAGSVDSEGDATHQASQARQTYAVTGAGVSVGVLSDSIDNGRGALAAAYNSADLDKANTVTISGQAGSGEGEGLAMLEIVHDLAPGAKLYFAQGGPDEAQMAANIRSLASAGCKIVLDDITFDDESPFQDGVIAQAVNAVCAQGVLYFSAAANSGNLEQKTPSVWEGDFKDGGDASAIDDTGARYHLFTSPTGTTTKMNKIIDNGSDGTINLFWSDPLGKSTNDYDLFMVNANGEVVDSSTDSQDGAEDPYENIASAKAGDFVEVVKFSGDARFLHVEVGELQFAVGTTGDTRGHNADSSATAFCVAAAPAHGAFDTGQPVGPYPNAYSTSSKTETFTSDGPRHMFYKADGTAYTPGNVSASGGQTFAKPDFTAADGVVTTLPASSGLNPFFGTSAATPHAGALAALLLSYKPGLTPAQAAAYLRAGVVKIPETAATAGTGILLAPNILKEAAGADDPVITSSLNPPSREGVAFSYQITATNNPTSYSVHGFPGGLGLSKSTGRVSGTPNRYGTFHPVVTATNSAGSGSATLTMVVKEALPVITSNLAPASIQHGAAFSYQITATNSPTSYGASGLPAGLSANTATGKITGTPTKAGTYNVTVKALNSGGTGTATLKLVIN